MHAGSICTEKSLRQIPLLKAIDGPLQTVNMVARTADKSIGHVHMSCSRRLGQSTQVSSLSLP